MERGVAGEPLRRIDLVVEIALHRLELPDRSRRVARHGVPQHVAFEEHAKIEISSTSDAARIGTKAPRFASTTSNPSAWSRVSASRTGIRLTPNSAARSSCRSAVPGGHRPPWRALRSALATRSTVVDGFMDSCIQYARPL